MLAQLRHVLSQKIFSEIKLSADNTEVKVKFILLTKYYTFNAQAYYCMYFIKRNNNDQHSTCVITEQTG